MSHIIHNHDRWHPLHAPDRIINLPSPTSPTSSQHLTIPSPPTPPLFSSYHLTPHSHPLSPELPRFLVTKPHQISNNPQAPSKPLLSSPPLSQRIYPPTITIKKTNKRTHPPHYPDHKVPPRSPALSARTRAPRLISERRRLLC